MAVGVGLGDAVAELVVGVGRLLQVRVDDLHETARAVVPELRDLAGRVALGDAAALGVVGRLGVRPLGIARVQREQRLRPAVVLVVLVLGDVALRVRDLREVAVGVIDEPRVGDLRRGIGADRRLDELPLAVPEVPVDGGVVAGVGGLVQAARRVVLSVR